MDEIIKTLYSPVFWVATVVVSLLVNLISSYAKDLIDKLWAGHSAKRREQLQRRTDARAKRLQLMATDLKLIEHLRHVEIRKRFNLVQTMFIMTMILLVVTASGYSAKSNPVFLGIMGLFAVFTVLDWFKTILTIHDFAQEADWATQKYITEETKKAPEQASESE